MSVAALGIPAAGRDLACARPYADPRCESQPSAYTSAVVSLSLKVGTGQWASSKLTRLRQARAYYQQQTDQCSIQNGDNVMQSVI